MLPLSQGWEQRKSPEWRQVTVNSQSQLLPGQLWAVREDDVITCTQDCNLVSCWGYLSVHLDVNFHCFKVMWLKQHKKMCLVCLPPLASLPRSSPHSCGFCSAHEEATLPWVLGFQHLNLEGHKYWDHGDNFFSLDIKGCLKKIIVITVVIISTTAHCKGTIRNS